MAASEHDSVSGGEDLSNNDEESRDSCSPATSKPMRPRNVGDRRKVSDTDFKYNCEWTACSYVASSMNEFNHHVSLHRRGYTQSLGPDEEIGSAQFTFYCQWQGCNALIEGQIDDFTRHVFYHTFHQFLKFQGQHIQRIENLKKCTLGTAARNIIPELPEKLLCRWEDCGMVYDNPYIFYSHASHHWEDYPKGNNPNVAIKCKWEGCTAICKSGHKLREHIRSHTQAKVVACPTCGSLFASNTRFIDHLIRQELETNFECSHCHNRFSSERILREHMRQHINQYKCPMCDMTCHAPSAVRDHVRYRHSQEKSFPCPECSYRGKSAGDVRRHSRCHEVREMFTCAKPGCGKLFKKRTELLEHYSTEHEVVREYGCHICTKRFSRGTLLTTHLKEIHSYRWPSGHRRFRYTLGEGGLKRLETIRYESIEVSQQILGQDLAAESALPFQTTCSVAVAAVNPAQSTTNSGDPPEAAKETGELKDQFAVSKKNVKKFIKDSDDSRNDPSNSCASSGEQHDTDSDPKNNGHDTDGDPKNSEAKSKGRCNKRAAESAVVNQCSADVSNNGELDKVASKRRGRKRKNSDSQKLAPGLQESGVDKKPPLV